MLKMFYINIIFYSTINIQKIIIQNWIIINILKDLYWKRTFP